MYGATAHVYDLVYAATGKDYGAEAAVVDEEVQARRPGAQTLLDVACGTGRHLEHLRRSYDVTGVDLEPAMLDVARARLPGVVLVEGDMRSLALGRTFDAVVCLFSAIAHMTSTEDLARAVAAMAAHLSPSGVLLVDAFVRPDAWRAEASTHLETAEADGVKVARCGRAVRDGRIVHAEMHHLIATDAGVEHLVDHHELTLFEPAEYVAALERAGLTAEIVASPYPDRDRYVGQPSASSSTGSRMSSMPR
jgi:dTDP-3-amino-3,6-dideoxy-alpha-D-glucopyranose N,N-dimethyltransferase/dTDP-3-amino-3,4,6-trideoxy-alpha-D-glucopyranose N,N-dimethyltransferase/N-methyltransferase